MQDRNNMAPDGVRIQAYGKAFLMAVLMAVGRRPALPIHPVEWNLGSAYHSPLNRLPASIRQAWVFSAFAAAAARQPFLNSHWWLRRSITRTSA